MGYFIVVCGSREEGFAEVGFIETVDDDIITACRKVLAEIEVCVGDCAKIKFHPQFGVVMIYRAGKNVAMNLPEIKSGAAFRELVCVSREK